MIPASDIVSRVRTIINDTREEYRNGDTEIFGWIMDCLNTILTARPELFTKVAQIALLAGPDQTVAGVTRAVAFAGVEGYPRADLAALDYFRPGWRSGAATAVLENWGAGNTGPLSFTVFPPSLAGQSIPVLYVETPAPITQLTDPVGLPDNMIAPVVQYCVALVESKDDEHVNSNRAAQAKADFLALIKGA